MLAWMGAGDRAAQQYDALIREDPEPTTAVPEPSTLVLMLTAAAGLVRTRRRARPTGPAIVS